MKFPAIASEWHPTKNKGLKPSQVLARSHIVAWWVCQKEHEWSTAISYRTGRVDPGCPRCAGRIVSAENNLISKAPTVAQEWHPAKNGSLRPENVRPSSSISAWWQCPSGHEWEYPVNRRVNEGIGCPFCAGKRLSPERSLLVQAPDVASEWHPLRNGKLTAADVSARSGKKAWWKCSEKGHEWRAVIQSRAKGVGCPTCSGRAVGVDNNLGFKRPDLANEWHPTKNRNVTPSKVYWRSGNKYWWRCEARRHEWRDSPGNRVDRSKCPFCSGVRVSPEYNLAVINPIVAKEWHHEKNGKLSPDMVLPNSNRKAWWICRRKHEWEASVANRNKGKGCPYCNNAQTSEAEIRLFAELGWVFGNVSHRRKVLARECDLLLDQLKLGIEVDGGYWHRGSEEKDRAKSEALSEGGIKLIRLRGKGLSKIMEWDLLLDEDQGVTPEVVTDLLRVIEKLAPLNEGILKKVRTYSSEQKFQAENEFSRLRSLLPSPLPGKSLLDANPAVARQWHPTKNSPLGPGDVYPNSSQWVWWVCEIGHDWDAPVGERNSGNGCPFCAGKRVDRTNSLEFLYPDVSRSWHPLKNGELRPCDVSARSNRRAWWLCDKGHEWQTSVANRTAGKGCRTCSYVERGRRRRERKKKK